MRRPPTIAAIGVVTFAIVLAGCTDNEPGTALPTDTSGPAPTTSDESPPTSGDSNSDDPSASSAPEVENPIDTSEFEQQPCRMLTDEQAHQAGLVPPGEPGEGAVAPSCSWRNRGTGAYVNVQFDDVSRRGLSGAYAANDVGKYELWLELDPIEGFPAVAASLGDSRDTGECPVLVGTSDEVTFQLTVELSEAKRGQTDPCEAAAQVAALALQTMKAN